MALDQGIASLVIRAGPENVVVVGVERARESSVFQLGHVSGIWAVLLTNRVHYGRGVAINPQRRAFHNIVVQILG